MDNLFYLVRIYAKLENEDDVKYVTDIIDSTETRQEMVDLYPQLFDETKFPVEVIAPDQEEVELKSFFDSEESCKENSGFEEDSVFEIVNHKALLDIDGRESDKDKFAALISEYIASKRSEGISDALSDQ